MNVSASVRAPARALFAQEVSRFLGGPSKAHTDTRNCTASQKEYFLTTELILFSVGLGV